jgi:hypothetical protein
MIPTLLLPGALAALAALIIPLVIHIARRSEQLPTDFAALRWLRAKPRPRSRLRFDEWLLLLLRLALLTALALWLARPVIFGSADTSPYIAVVPGVDLTQARAMIPKSVQTHWLAPGFPAFDSPGPNDLVPLASLVRQLDAELPTGTPLTIVVPQRLAGTDAERPRLSRKVEWRIVPGAMPSASPTPSPPPALSIRYDADHAAGLRYLRAAAVAWQSPGHNANLDEAPIDSPLPEAGRTLVWLGGGTLPAPLVQWIKRGGTAIAASDAIVPSHAARVTLWSDDVGRPLVEATPMGGGRLLRFTRRLVPSEMPALLEPDFPVRLRAVIDPPPPPPTRATANDYAPVTGGRGYDQLPRDLRPWLAILIALLLLAERWLATRGNRAVSP